MSDRDSDLGSFLSGVIIGGLLGAAAALLLAPQSGEETREIIKEKGIELRDKAQETAEEARTRATELAHQVESRSKEIYDQQRERITKAVESGKSAMEQKKTEMGGEPPVESM